MHLLGAKRTSHNKIRFVFVTATDDAPDVLSGDGSILEITDFSDLKVSGDTPLKASLLEAWVETMVEGDKEHTALGPIECGFGISGDEVQIVTYGEAKSLVSCRGKYFSYMANIKTDELDSE